MTRVLFFISVLSVGKKLSIIFVFRCNYLYCFQNAHLFIHLVKEDIESATLLKRNCYSLLPSMLHFLRPTVSEWCRTIVNGENIFNLVWLITKTIILIFCTASYGYVQCEFSWVFDQFQLLILSPFSHYADHNWLRHVYNHDTHCTSWSRMMHRKEHRDRKKWETN